MSKKLPQKNTLLDLIKEKSDESTAHAKINAEEKLASEELLTPQNNLTKAPPHEPTIDDIESPSTLGIPSRINVRNTPVLLPVKGPQDGEQEQISTYSTYSFKSKKTFEFDAHLMQAVENILRHQPGRSLVDFVETAVRAYARKLERENGGPFPLLKDYRKRR